LGSTPNWTPFSRRRFLAAAAVTPRERRPNVLLLATGRNAAAADRLAPEGLRFSRAYAACPSYPFWRASILTGRFPHAMRAAGPCEEPTLVSELKRAGYATGFIGDWGCDRPAGAVRDATGFIRANIPNDFCLCAARDAGAGDLLRTLEETGLGRDTIVVFVAGDDDAGGPGEESVRVPLVVRYSRRIQGGRTIEFPVSTVDLAPTLLACCGVAVPPSMQGRDLSDLILTGKGDPPESVYAEGGLRGRDEWRMVVRGLDKLVVNTRLEATHLYNLGQDPFETTNLAADGAERRKRDELLALLRRWILRTGDRPERR
jgi:arylsulfatase A-like enzyme